LAIALGVAVLGTSIILRASEFPERTKAAMAGVNTNDLLRHIQVLSSDAFEGRAPGTPGEERSVDYLVGEFEKLGLKPGNPDGSYIQHVPLTGFRAQPAISFLSAAERLDLRSPSEAVIWSRHFVPEVKIESSEVIFAGYGVVAPEYGWDDYKEVDVRGKTILMLINDPAIPDPNDPSKLDDKMFKGRAMTYYGRWTYKYEIATAKGAAAAIIVHETEPAAYPWAVVEGSNSRENFDLVTPDRNRGRVPIEGWITLEKAQKLCAMGGQKFETLKEAAQRRDFRPVPLQSKATFTVKNTLREIASRNVIAKVDGTDPKLKDEYLIYTAHWDHLGRDPQLEGDQIYNGAADNASGIAVLLELAEAFTMAKPKRTVLFLAVTAEEKGLLGAKFYAGNPLYPLERTLANINMDNMNTWGRTRDIGIVGVGQSSLEDTLRSVAATQDRVVLPEPEPEKGYYFRSDHFEFAKRGVPALYTDDGTDFIGQSKEFGLRKRQEYIARDYHKVTDEIKPGWDLSGLVADTQLLFQVGYAVAEGTKWPEWKPGSEFKSRREEMLQKVPRP
jgi:Zn-dependent M28 family amino/carboxypeptidase